MKNKLRLPALAVQQNPGRILYSFAVDGKQLHDFAAVSRVHRDKTHGLAGYQRAESIAHIRTIRKYLETRDAMLPNALVVAFDPRVRFVPARGTKKTDEVRAGHLEIPLEPDQDDSEKAGWIVDGQQRSAAIRDADIERFPVCVTAFITDSVSEQRTHFILVNSTKPLPKGLIHELLPATPEAALPIQLLKRRYPALLLDRLNYDPDSPLYRRIRTPTTAEGTIKDNSILKMLVMSIEDGALYYYFDSDTGQGDTESMLALVKSFWHAVANVFPAAWNEPPRRSRLVHGVGIMSLGALMDEIAYELRERGIPTSREFAEHLTQVADACRWTEGIWDLAPDDQRRWNELQNTPRDVKALSDHLLRTYRSTTGSPPAVSAAA